MSNSKAVATRETPSVPELVPTPATTLTAEDIVVPRLYVANYMSEAFKRKRADFGDVFLAAGADDTEPNVLWSLDSTEPGVLAHILHVRKGLSYAGPTGKDRLESWQFGDPNAHPDAFTTYNYTLFLPEVDPEMPAKLLLTKSGRPVAQRINTVLGRAHGPMFTSAFRITSAKRQKDDNEWAIFQAAQVAADPAHVEQAAALYTLIAPGLANEAARQSTNPADEPGI